MSFLLAAMSLSCFFAATCGAQSAEIVDPDDDMQTYLAGMPKAELHLHLEGTLSPETIVEITNRNDIDYFRTTDEVEQSLANRPPGLMGFLEHHFRSQNVMQTRQDFYDATYKLIEKLHENNVIYTDLFFDPQAHTARGIAFDDMFAGIDEGRRDAEAQFGVTVNLIMCINRERPVSSAFEMLDQAYAVRDKIIGLGMDSGPEYGNPPLKFQDVYARARQEGYFLTGHHDVDVRDSVKHIWQSIDTLQLDRIDHGLNAIDDPALVSELVRRGICLTGSPVKRSTDPAPQDVDRILGLDAAGVCVSLNSDDPEEFESGYLTNMLIQFHQASDYSRANMTRLMLNAFNAIWLPETEKHGYITELKHYAIAHGVDWEKVTRNESTHADDAGEKSVESLSPEVRELLSKEMLAIQDGMMSMIPAYASGNFAELATIAESIKNSYILQQNLSRHQKHELHTALPESFIQLDKQFHNYAGLLAEAANNSDSELVGVYFLKLVESCSGCHSQHATHRFPDFREQSEASTHSR